MSYNPNPHDPYGQQGNQYGQYGPQGYQYGPGQYNPNQYNPQGGGQRQQDKGSDGGNRAAWITGCLGIVAAVVGAIVAAVLTNGFGLMQHTPTVAVVQLHSDYNAGTWTETAGQVVFSLNGIVESSDGTFTAAGGMLGPCTISISNGVVKPNNSVSVSLTQIADSGNGCPNATAELKGTVTSDGSSLSGTWSGQLQGSPLSGSWTLT